MERRDPAAVLSYVISFVTTFRTFCFSSFPSLYSKNMKRSGECFVRKIRFPIVPFHTSKKKYLKSDPEEKARTKKDYISSFFRASSPAISLPRFLSLSFFLSSAFRKNDQKGIEENGGTKKKKQRSFSSFISR